MPFSIREDDPGAGDVVGLLKAHLEHSRLHSPPTSIHTLSVASLQAPEITFWTVREGPALVGCGAVKELDARHGEVKSMHVAAAYRGQGVGALVMAHLIEEARRRSYRRLSLETGSMAAYAPARALYRRFGFQDCPPFAAYRDDPNSVYMTLDLKGVPPVT